MLQASPSKGVNAVTGEGLQAALAGADIVVDVSNSPSFEDKAVLDFFETGTRNLICGCQAGRRAELRRAVGRRDRPARKQRLFPCQAGTGAADTLLQDLPTRSCAPPSSSNSVGAVADFGRRDGEVHVSSQLMQPLLSDDVAVALADATLGEPANGIREVAGPEAASAGGLSLAAGSASRAIAARSYRAPTSRISARRSHSCVTLVPEEGARIMPTRFDDWLGRAAA